MYWTTRRRTGLLAAVILCLIVVLLILFWPGQDTGPFDYIAWKADELGNDPPRIIAFVQDQIAHEPYEGSLRGPVGTLWSGAGNDVDQSHLLAALLRAAGRTARLARGKSTWVQLQEGPQWKDIKPIEALETGEAEWTGESPAEDLRHMLTITLRLTGKAVREEQSLQLTTSELASHPLIVAFSPGTCTLSLQGAGRRVSIKVNAADDETLQLVFSHLAPGQAQGHVVTRELYSRKYADYRVPDDPRNRHAVIIAPGRIPSWVYKRELALTNSHRKPMPDEPSRHNYILALTHLARSDEALAKISQHFNAKAYVTRPRIIIASTVYGKDKTEPTCRTLDLRSNRVHVEGDEKARAAVALTRSAYEGQLEAQVLTEATGVPSLSALRVLTGAFEPGGASTPERLRFYQSNIEHLLGKADAGTKLTLLLDADRQVVLERGKKQELLIRSISPALAAKMKESNLPWSVLTAGHIAPGNAAMAAMELEVLFGPVAGSPTNYRPKLELEESTERILATNSRVFLLNRLEPDKPPEVTIEYQILSTDGDLRYECIDYWNEVSKRRHRQSYTFRIPAKSIESSDVLSYHYSQGLYDKGGMFLLASRKVHRELTAKGETTIRYLKANGTFTDPIKLFLVERTTKTVYVNNRPRKLPFLWAAGGWVKDKPSRKPWKDVKKILIDNIWTANRWGILDNPQFPLIGIAGAHFQTALPGRVVSAKTALGVPDAKVAVKGTKSSTVTWGDGRFQLPLIKGRLETHTVTVSHPNYAPLSVKVDLAKPDALPMKLELVPQVAPERFVWVKADNADAQLAKVKTSDRVRDLIRQALADEPHLVALVPTTRTPFGMGEIHAWMLLDPRDMHITGVTEDGLHGASSAVGWARRGGQDIRTGAMSAYAGYISSWYVYSAGRLDAIGKMMDGETFGDHGHRHAMRFAVAWLNGMESLIGSGLAGAASRAAGVNSELFKAGFMAGLSFFESNPDFSGG